MCNEFLVLISRLVLFLCHYICVYFIMAGERDKAQKRGFYSDLIFDRRGCVRIERVSLRVKKLR